MTKDEFEWAWNQSPSPAAAELFLHPDAIVKIEKPMDRRWHYKGLIPGHYCDWAVPCPCQASQMLMWAANQEIPQRTKEAIAYCRGAQWNIGPAHGWIYAGKCDECGRVYWLERLRGT